MLTDPDQTAPLICSGSALFVQTVPILITFYKILTLHTVYNLHQTTVFF